MFEARFKLVRLVSMPCKKCKSRVCRPFLLRSSSVSLQRPSANPALMMVSLLLASWSVWSDLAGPLPSILCCVHDKALPDKLSSFKAEQLVNSFLNCFAMESLSMLS